MAGRVSRQHLLRRIIAAGGVQSQSQLVDQLRDRGIEVTQATLSRDLAELGVLKGADGYVLPSETAAGGPSFDRVARSCLVSVAVGGTTVVLKTAPGQASFLGVALDAEPTQGPLGGVLGTIAGDDCLFVAARDDRSAARIAAHLRAVAGLPASSSSSTGARRPRALN